MDLSDYYEATIKEIEDFFATGQDEKAKARISEELSVPYIPKDVEERLKAIEAEHMDYDVAPPSLEKIEEYLSSEDPAIQLAGISALIKLNLREHIDIINTFLSEDKFIDAKVLLVDELIAQGIRDEFTIVKHDIEYKFIPLYCERPIESEGYVAAIEHLQDTIGIEDPTLAQLCKSLISRIALMQLPLSLSEEEGILIAKSAIAYVYALFDDERFRTYKDAVGSNLIDKSGIEELLEGC